jgi:hypothetical protein
MADPATVSEDKTVDIGIEKGAEKLTPEKIEQVSRRVQKN